MGANRPKRQHYVPKLLIKNFLNQDGRVWLGNTETGRVSCTGPVNAFVESEQYTRYGFGPDGEEKDYRYEEAIASLESEVGPVVAEIVDSARGRRPPRLLEREVSAIQRFILLQARRTAESRRRVSSRRDPDELFFEAAASVFVGQGHDPPSKDLLAEPGMREFAKRILHNVDAQFSAGDHPDLAEEEAKFCRETSLCVAVIDLQRRSFILGSHGLTIREPVGSKWLRGSLLPVAHDVIVQVSPFAGQVRLLCLDEGSDCLIRDINRTTALQSRWIAGKSERLIRSLV
jgi:hypothetical protein